MFGEISLLAWMGSAIVFAIGGGAGFFIARQIKDKRTLELEQQLQATQNKLTDYQDDVNRHFLKSSLLFSKLTDNYREVYEHLATGAQKLCNEKPVISALDLPDTKILSAAVPSHEQARAEKINQENPATDTTAPEISAVEPLTTESLATEEFAKQEHAAEQHTEEELLGVESIVAHQAVSESHKEADSKEEKTPTTESASEEEKTVTTAQATTEEQTTNQPEDNTPVISEEELKTLEASEKEKEEAEDVHLGAESTPGVELDHHKTHSAIH